MITANIVGSLIGIAFAVIATAGLNPTSIIAFIIFAAWTSAPFIVALILSLTHENKKGIGIGIYLSLCIGLLMFIDIRYWHPDAQGGIAFLGLPIICAIIIITAVNIVNGHKTRNNSNQRGRS